MQLTWHQSGDIATESPIYPSSKTLYLEAIKEQVPVFEEKFRITQDVSVTFSKVRDGVRSLLSSGKRFRLPAIYPIRLATKPFAIHQRRCR
jgi:hypothetical protein